MLPEPEKIEKHNSSVDKTLVADTNEPEYPYWYTKEFFVNFFCSMPDEFIWNIFMCAIVLVMVVLAIMESDVEGTSPLDIAYNVVYFVHVASIATVTIRRSHSEDITLSMKVGFLMDLVSYLHYALNVSRQGLLKLVCYCMRLHRPFRYIWTVENNNMQGSLIVTTLKYIYICLVLRATCAYMWLHVDSFESVDELMPGQRMLLTALQQSNQSEFFFNEPGKRFFVALYVINKMFIPIGASMTPVNDLERLSFLLVMMIGCLVVTGATVASLSSVISIYMRPEENFRTRYRLLIQEMTNSRIPPSLREKVETFYKMYWHKQRAVSATQLLPSFPPVLPKSVYIDIYFEAMQKSRILRDLSYQFLSEVAQKMETIHYIPGDSIIKRNSTKDSIIYIAYGDIEMLTAEDDISPMLRFTRGTILTPYGVCPAGGGRAHVQIRAATFCTAHVLRAEDLWRTALKHGRENGQNAMLLSELKHHMERVKRHYASERKHQPTKFNSSILHFKRSLMALKETKDDNGELLLTRTDYLLEVAGCYNMRNRADASLTDDADAICLRQTFPCILQPSSSLLTAWNWLVACLIVVICFTHPYFLVFKKTIPLEFRFFDGMMTIVYVLDIIAFLSTGANVEEGVPITFVQTSSQQMRNYWFGLDVLGTVPMFEIIADGEFAGINKILRLPKFFQMMKTLEADCVYHSNIVRFFTYLLLLVIACYLVAALQQGFMCFHFGYCLVTNFTQPPFWTEASLDDESVSNRLTFGLYWATSMITFTSHMETWGVEKLTNALYTMLVLEVSIILHIFIETVYSATIMVTTAFREDYSACIANVRNFLIRNNVDAQLRQRFITYLELCWYTDKAYSMTVKQSSVFYDLPPHVYQDILARQRSKYILCIPFMKLLHKEDLKNISSNARMFYTSPNEILLNTGDISTEMYVIKQGMCQILNPDTKEVVGSLVAKSHFGVLECLLRLPAFYTVRACTHVQVFSISRKHLVNAVEMPQIKDAIEFAKEQQEYHRLLLRREPFIYYLSPPPVPTKETFRLPRKHEKDLAFLQPFKKLGTFSVLRYTFPRYTFRPDSVFLTRYELFRALCAFASSMLFPSYTYMVLQFPRLRWAKRLLDLLAVADTLFRMLIGYFDDNGILVYHPASTAAHYLRGAYLVDIFSCLPLEILETDRRYPYGDFYQVTMTKQVLMMNRLLQLYRLPGALVVLTGYMERQDFRLVLQALPMFLMMLNVLTSLLVFSSVRIYHSGNERNWAIVPSEDKGGSWIHLFHDSFRFNLTSSPWNLYLSCSFWIVYEATTTGYNNFSPSNHEIMDVLFLAMVIGSMTMTYVCVRIISIRANVNKVLATFQEHMKDLEQFMQHERLSKTLQKELVDFYEYSWDKTGGVEYRNVLKLCDQITLRTDAILHLYGPTFGKCPILSQCDVSLLRILGRAVRSVYFLKNTTVINKNDVVQNLYFVASGTLHVRTTEKDFSTITVIAIGSVFGNLEDYPTRQPAAVVAMTNVHLLEVNSHAFHQIVLDCDFPAVHRLMSKYRPNNEMYIQGSVRGPLTAESRERGLSSPIILRSRRRLVKYLHLKNTAVQVYLIVICLLCIYTDVYNAGFQVNSVPMLVALYIFDIGFAFKILLHCSLPYIVEDRTDVKILLMKVKRKYYKSEFKYDVASCLPIELFSFLSAEHQWVMFSWLRLNRVLRIITIHSCTKHFKDHVAGNLILSVTVLFVWFTLFVHASTCLWYFIGLMEDMVDPGTSWFYDDNGKELNGNKYICSLYFVLTTFSQNGAGDIMPKKQSEVLFVSVLQVLTTMVYMVYVGEFSNIIQYTSFRSFSYYSKYLELQEFLKNNRVSVTLVKLVNKYTVHLWREARGEQMPYFLIIAPRCLKLKVMSAAYLDELSQHPVFRTCEPDLLRQLVGYFRQYYYDEDMYVVKESEITDSMYLVHAGKVEERSEYQSDAETLKTYTAGEYIGVYQGLVRDQPFPYSYRTIVKSQVLTLRLDDWEYLLDHFPVSKAAINKYQRFSGDDGDNSAGVSKITESSDGNSKSPVKKSSDGLGGVLPDEILAGLQRGSTYQSLRGTPKESKSGSSNPSTSSSNPITPQKSRTLKPDSQVDSFNHESSSTILFEELRKAATSIPDKESLPSSTALKSSVSLRGVEDYLSDKYKLDENYPVVPFTSAKANEGGNDGSNEFSVSSPASRNTHVRYQDENYELSQDSDKNLTEQRDAVSDGQGAYTINEILPGDSHVETTQGPSHEPTESSAIILDPSLPEVETKSRIKGKLSIASESLKADLLALKNSALAESQDESQALSVYQRATSPHQDNTGIESIETTDQTQVDSRKAEQAASTSANSVSQDKVSQSSTIRSAAEKNLAALDSDVVIEKELHKQASTTSKTSNVSYRSVNSKASTTRKHKKKKKKD